MMLQCLPGNVYGIRMSRNFSAGGEKLPPSGGFSGNAHARYKQNGKKYVAVQMRGVADSRFDGVSFLCSRILIFYMQGFL